MSSDKNAVIHEIFSGIQGEGMLVGLRQIFVRFHGCNLACAYCDTPASQGKSPATCTVECVAGSRELQQLHNPLTIEQVLKATEELDRDYPHHSVSFTGGEPLLHHEFLGQLLSRLHAMGKRSFLETNGVLSEALESLTEPPHYIAMDMKLPSTTGSTPCWAAHADFLDTALRLVSKDHVQVKLVFAEQSLTDIAQAVDVIAACRKDVACILQPVTPHPGGPTQPTAQTVLAAQRLAATRLDAVRVIPQTHVMLGQW